MAAEYTRWLNATNTLTNTAQPALMDELTKRLLELEYPPLTYLEAINRTAAASTSQATVRGTSLLGNAAATTTDRPGECTDLQGKRGQDLVDQINKSAWGELTKWVTETTKLEGVVGVICQKR